MKQLVLCPHCQAIPATDQARFCGKCGKPLTPPHWVTDTQITPAAQVTTVQPVTSPTATVSATNSKVAVVSPAFPAPITPTFNDRHRRIFFACTASPIIGVGLGAEPAMILGMWLESCGWPSPIVGLCTLTGLISVTSLVAYIILADKIAFLNALVTRRKIESVSPVEKMNSVQTVVPQDQAHQWVD